MCAQILLTYSSYSYICVCFQGLQDAIISYSYNTISTTYIIPILIIKNQSAVASICITVSLLIHTLYVSLKPVLPH